MAGDVEVFYLFIYLFQYYLLFILYLGMLVHIYESTRFMYIGPMSLKSTFRNLVVLVKAKSGTVASENELCSALIEDLETRGTLWSALRYALASRTGSRELPHLSDSRN